MKKWWEEHWYGVLVILIVGGIILYFWGLKDSGSIEGILVKTDSGTMYLLNLEGNYDQWGTIGLTQQAKELLDLTKLNTGDHISIQGDIEILESWPLQYDGVKKIVVNQTYDAESLQRVRDAVQSLGHELWHGAPIYPE